MSKTVMPQTLEEICARLPGKDCGQCGFATCAALAAYVVNNPDAIKRCIYVGQPVATAQVVSLVEEEITWKDMLDREYDFILEKFTEDPGPRETISPLNPGNVEKLGIRKGDVLYGRPVWVGCPITHVGVVVEEPDYFNGTFVWCVVGQMAARERGRDIGLYNPIAYEGIVRHTRKELRIGERYNFLPRTCMLQSRHSGLVNAMAKREEGTRVRVEGIWIS